MGRGTGKGQQEEQTLKSHIRNAVTGLVKRLEEGTENQRRKSFHGQKKACGIYICITRANLVRQGYKRIQ